METMQNNISVVKMEEDEEDKESSPLLSSSTTKRETDGVPAEGLALNLKGHDVTCPCVGCRRIRLQNAPLSEIRANMNENAGSWMNNRSASPTDSQGSQTSQTSSHKSNEVKTVRRGGGRPMSTDEDKIVRRGTPLPMDEVHGRRVRRKTRKHDDIYNYNVDEHHRVTPNRAKVYYDTTTLRKQIEDKYAGDSADAAARARHNKRISSAQNDHDDDDDDDDDMMHDNDDNDDNDDIPFDDDDEDNDDDDDEEEYDNTNQLNSHDRVAQLLLLMGNEDEKPQQQQQPASITVPASSINAVSPKHTTNPIANPPLSAKQKLEQMQREMQILQQQVAIEEAQEKHRSMQESPVPVLATTEDIWSTTSSVLVSPSNNHPSNLAHIVNATTPPPALSIAAHSTFTQLPTSPPYRTQSSMNNNDNDYKSSYYSTAKSKNIPSRDSADHQSAQFLHALANISSISSNAPQPSSEGYYAKKAKRTNLTKNPNRNNSSGAKFNSLEQDRKPNKRSRQLSNKAATLIRSEGVQNTIRATNNTQPLKDWFNAHQHNPYPNIDEKKKLAGLSGLAAYQVSNWFINARLRHWKPPQDLDISIIKGDKRKKSSEAEAGKNGSTARSRNAKGGNGKDGEQPDAVDEKSAQAAVRLQFAVIAREKARLAKINNPSYAYAKTKPSRGPAFGKGIPTQSTQPLVQQSYALPVKKPESEPLTSLQLAQLTDQQNLQKAHEDQQLKRRVATGKS